MAHVTDPADLVISLSSPRTVAESRRGGGHGVLDLGADHDDAVRALRAALSLGTGPVGVRVGAGCALGAEEFARLAGGRCGIVVLTDDAPWPVGQTASAHRVLVEAHDAARARAAVAAGAHGVIARGAESGRGGELSTFVLLQQVLDAVPAGTPVWAAGGIGARTAVACVLGGAAGVVLDVQLALMPESELPDGALRILRQADGTRPDPDTGVGPDSWLAKDFAARWDGTAAAVRGIRALIDAAVRGPVPRTSGPGAPLAEALGVRLPVAQGPMTRVSDGPGFAAAVAEAGGLPFLALALADGQRAARILDDARAALNGRPWGVGLLGFVPEELRAAQLAAVLAHRPDYAVIAGGRPAQATALERAGIPAFLHVPSPGLLEQFLRAGSRRFVFEGSECGGHIGPRSSFVLWEAQAAVLEEFLDGRSAEDAAQVQVFFAGGVHDARSAAMVAALAAPLCERGVRIGVLMGTAYLFTEEAVRHGAIRPLFQRKLLAARRTAVLETSPGHVTRCLDNDFVEEFARRRDALAEAGGDRREQWEQLELLNTGRLRLAAKGRERDGTEVDEATQSTQGLYMAGQVAVLRDAPTTVDVLHRQVGVDAERFLRARIEALRARMTPAGAAAPQAAPCDIAVVGMACAFPGSTDLDGFWHTVLSGADVIREVPAERWDPDTYFTDDPAATKGGRRVLSRWGGFLPRIPIDPIRLGIPPSALGSVDPGQLLALEVAERTLADAGYRHDAPDAEHSRTGVVFGAQSGGDVVNATMFRAMLPAYLGDVPEELESQLPAITEDTFPGNLPNVIAGRIANRLDLGGVNFTVDAACAASLAAIDVAVKELTTGAADLMLCGAVDIHNSIGDYVMFGSVQALSPTGRARTFDDSADGTVLGEGVGCVALKRLADAEADGDRIYAVIKGVGSASDGRALGLTAPSEAGQVRALRRAYAQAGTAPAEVGLVEAHGTGTVVGDRTELLSLTTMFSSHGVAPGSCVLGSVKSQIGHTKNAAGLAGLIKAVLAIHSGVLPPTGHLTRPNAAWDATASPFAFLTAPRPWLAPPSQRVAGVSAFGFGGTNYHVVLRGHAGTPEPRHAAAHWPVELLTFRGPDRAAVHRAVRSTVDALGTVSLRELAARDSDPRLGPVRLAVVAGDLDTLGVLLRRALDGEHDPAAGLIQPPQAGTLDAPPVAFLFPGQGSQRSGALGELFVHFPETRHYLRLGARFADLLLPTAAFTPDGVKRQAEALRATTVAQPVLGIGGLAVDHVLRGLGVRPAMAGGHSYGELVALCTAGAFDPETLLDLSVRRADAIVSAVGDDPGTMAAVGASAARVAGLLSAAGFDDVVLANHNGPAQTVISGPTASVGGAVAALRDAGVSVRDLPVACAFHSPVVAAGGPVFADVLARTPVRAPRTPVWSNRTATPYDASPQSVRDGLAAQIGAPVRWVEQIEAMYAAGARVFVEAGPGRVLTTLVDAVLGDRPHLAIACDGGPGNGLRGLLTALGELACAGVPVETGRLVRGRVPAPARGGAARPLWTADGHLVRDADGRPVPGGLTPARPIKELRMSNGTPPPERERLIEEYLRISREQVAAQRDVMLAYLGQPAGSSPPGPAIPAGPPVITATAVVEQPEPAPAKAPVDPEHLVREVISERTGYPVELIEVDLDLEADLGIDSIKRAEMAGEVARTMGLATGDESAFEELVRCRTVRSIVDFLGTRAEAPGAAPAKATPAAPVDSAPAGEDPIRLLPAPVALPGAPTHTLTGARFLIVGASAVAAPMAALLTDAGAEAHTAPTMPDDDDHPFDSLVLLDGLTATGTPLPPALFPVLKRALGNAGLQRLLSAGDPALADTAGLAGMFRTAHREYPRVLIRHVEVDTALSPQEIAARLVDELRTEGDPVVAHREGGRFGWTGVPTALHPAPVDATALGLEPDSVVVLLGGARGITAWCAREFAATTGCRLVLAGRTRMDDEAEPADLADAPDLPALRAALARRGVAVGGIDTAAREVLARREVRATLADVRALGSEVSYRTLDVRNTDAVRQFVKAVAAEYGRLDGVVYAAGITEDRLIADKDPRSFARVFATKVDGARALLDGLAETEPAPGFVVLFGSVSAAYGTAGQVDYAAGNDALSTVGGAWAARTGRRCLTVHWGPWAPVGAHAGLVTPELARQYTREGVALIDPPAGAASLLRELAHGDPSVTSVIHTAPVAAR
jgi:acyl transferase domain-containing protein/NAD(P)H-dependent flavin oxidoreductase YrpB (nitropropane dioxygenase family)/acyl carrier protein